MLICLLKKAKNEYAGEHLEQEEFAKAERKIDSVTFYRIAIKSSILKRRAEQVS
ncbi:Undefined function [Listeria monocytogenes N53-1]|nr:Undefined function [Listeria monocytogenes N53-1]